MENLTGMSLIASVRRWFAKVSPPRLLVLGFGLVILIGTLLLWAPFSHKPGISLTFLEALFEATSAVCVTGLTVVGVGNTFNFFGQFVMAVLIQIGGMGVVLLSIAFILIAGGRVGYKTRALFIQAQNLFGFSGLVILAKKIFKIIFLVESVCALLYWPIFALDYGPWHGLGIALFHSVSAFNNAGFDILGGTDSLISYANNVPLCLITSFEVILGAFGFLSLIDLIRNKCRWKRLNLTTKICIYMTTILLLGGTLLLKITTSQTWLESWFQSVIARTAGFATVPLADFSSAGIVIFSILMFIGANPNSTGGGVKTTTVFVAGLKAISSSSAHDEDSCFYRKISGIVFDKAFTVLYFAIFVVISGAFLILTFQPQLDITQVFVEVISAFGTVGSSMGVTADLNCFSRLVIIIIMFIGRLGPVTIAGIVVAGTARSARYTEEDVLIG